MKHVAPFHQVVRREEPVEVSREGFSASPVGRTLRGYCPVRQESSALHSLVVLVHASWGHVGFNHACLTGVRAFRGKFTARMRHPQSIVEGIGRTEFTLSRLLPFLYYRTKASSNQYARR